MEKAGMALVWLLLALATAWAVASLAYDFAWQAAVAYAIALIAAFIFLRGRGVRLLTVLAAFLAVLGWWLMQKPSNDRNWQSDVARMPWTETQGNTVTLHNVRNFDYRTELDYLPNWETRTVDLGKIRGIDLFLNYWGLPWIAHPLLSFDTGDGRHLVFSIETRKTVGQTYSAVRGFFRQYELIYVIADERDVVRVRTNYRKDEEVYLYRTLATPERARAMFLEYAQGANRLRQHPQWYNALTSSCTTNIRNYMVATANGKPDAWSWRFLLNGKGDQMEYERGELATGGLPFAELRQHAKINQAARAADQSPDFSRRIREGRPGF